MELPRTLFVSRGNKAPAWYRCALPAMALGCDWVCYGNEPPELQLEWGTTQQRLSLADRYGALNPRTYVCQNGIDLKRFAVTPPERAHVGVGWAGATGHTEAIVPWLKEVATVMRARPDVHFISVGQGFANLFVEEFGARRALTVPFTALDVYPAAMAHYDIALAPAGDSNFYRGKSDLRWLEASAVGLPTIADPKVYPEIEHGVTGFHAASPGEMRELLELLIADRELRLRVGAAAKAYVSEHRSAQATARQWAAVLQSVGTTRAAA